MLGSARSEGPPFSIVTAGRTPGHHLSGTEQDGKLHDRGFGSQIVNPGCRRVE